MNEPRACMAARRRLWLVDWWLPWTASVTACCCSCCWCCSCVARPGLHNCIQLLRHACLQRHPPIFLCSIYRGTCVSYFNPRSILMSVHILVANLVHIFERCFPIWTLNSEERRICIFHFCGFCNCCWGCCCCLCSSHSCNQTVSGICMPGRLALVRRMRCASCQLCFLSSN